MALGQPSQTVHPQMAVGIAHGDRQDPPNPEHLADALGIPLILATDLGISLDAPAWLPWAGGHAPLPQRIVSQLPNGTPNCCRPTCSLPAKQPAVPNSPPAQRDTMVVGAAGAGLLVRESESHSRTRRPGRSSNRYGLVLDRRWALFSVNKRPIILGISHGRRWAFLVVA